MHKLVVAAVVTAIAACDQTAADVHRDYLERHEHAFVFRVDRAKIVAAVRALVADQGLELVEPTTGDPLHTTRGLRRSDATTEYTVHLIPVRNGYLVHVISQLRDREGQIFHTQRDSEMEWELAQRAEPDRALEITDAANKRADRVAPRARSL